MYQCVSVIATDRGTSDKDVFITLAGVYLDSMAGEEMSRDHDSIHDEGSTAVFDVEEPLEPAKMVRAADLSSVLPALEKVHCQPGPRTLVVNAVRISKGNVDHAQVIVLDSAEPPRVSCPIQQLFPDAPVGTRLTMIKKYSEFQFRPNETASQWIDAGKLDLQVNILDFSEFFPNIVLDFFSFGLLGVVRDQTPPWPRRVN